MKHSFLAIVIALLPFLSFVLFAHTRHVNFDFYQCSVFTECCF